jgi:hypothetical protein
MRDRNLREVDGMRFPDPSKIPENIRRLLPEEEQARLGHKAPFAHVPAQAPPIEETPELRKEERKLQEQIRAYLWGQHGLEVIIPPAVKKSALPTGWPDITFSYHGRAIALEVKTQKGKCTPEQLERHVKMRASPNFWTVEIVRSLEEVQSILRRLDHERQNGNGSSSTETQGTAP